MRCRFVGLLTVFLLVVAACGSSDDESDDAFSDKDEGTAFNGSEPLTLDDNISDNGYADITLGKSLDELRRTYGPATFVGRPTDPTASTPTQWTVYPNSSCCSSTTSSPRST